MKQIKIVVALGFAAVALAVSAGPASATILTSPAGTTWTKEVLSDAGKIALSGSFTTVVCQESFLDFRVDTHGSTVTAGGPVLGFGLTNCNFPIVSISNGGSIEIHTDGSTANGNGTVTWSGANFTIQTSVGVCGFTTNNTDLGTLTGGSKAVLSVASAKIPRTHGAGGFLCGSAGTLNATYIVEIPGSLYVD